MASEAWITIHLKVIQDYTYMGISRFARWPEKQELEVIKQLKYINYSEPKSVIFGVFAGK